MPQGWNFDDEEVQVPPGARPFAGSAAFPGAATPTEQGPKTKVKRKWRWPWQKETDLTGERVIALNNTLMNAEYCSNFVSTSKYNMASFVPKFLAGECALDYSANCPLIYLNRAILQIRQSFLSVHCVHSTST